MPDLPFVPLDAAREGEIAAAIDPEAKIVAAIDALGPVAARRVVLIGPAPRLAAALAARGAIVDIAHAGAAVSTAASAPAARPPGSADVVVAPWTGFDGAADAADLAEAERLLGPDGRLLVVQDYGRDDLTPVRGPTRTAALVDRSRRDGWFLRSGFRVHVVHAWWRFASVEEGAGLLRAAFGAAAEPLAGALRRPSVAHNVAIYHRAAGGADRDATVRPADAGHGS